MLLQIIKQEPEPCGKIVGAILPQIPFGPIIMEIFVIRTVLFCDFCYLGNPVEVEQHYRKRKHAHPFPLYYLLT